MSNNTIDTTMKKMKAYTIETDPTIIGGIKIITTGIKEKMNIILTPNIKNLT